MILGDFTWVETPRGLQELGDQLSSSSIHALDSESNSGFAYHEKLCLLQFQVNGKFWLVDLTAFLGMEAALDPLWPALESKESKTVLHGGEFDVACLRRDFGLQLGGVWDTQQAASLLGWEKTGYGAVVERICSVELPKAHSYFDWGRRPVQEDALKYAVDDVRYLLQIEEHLRLEVERADIEEEVRLATDTVMESTWNGGYQPGGFWKIKGVRTLDAVALQRLAALYRWRDSLARRVDLPPGRVLNNRVLLVLSRRSRTSLDELKTLGIPGRIRHERGEELVRLLDSSGSDGEELPPAPVQRGVSVIERQLDGRLRDWRTIEAQRRGVVQQLVLPSQALRHLAREGTSDLQTVPQLGLKRIALYGKQLQRLDPSRA
jgi:ribonuclease D